MVETVIKAFNEFLGNNVNLDQTISEKARRSRDWLVDQIKEFPKNDETFPKLHPDKKIFFGSFARKTKIRELDDIDIMVIIHAQGSKHVNFGDYVEIHVPENVKELNELCYDGTNILNSRKVINKYISLLGEVSQYEKAEMKRNKEAATLKLTSYSWNFDIVPCFGAQRNPWPKDCFLIPDGDGNWKRTDPRIDRDRVTTVNTSHQGRVLNVIRIMKYWNKRPIMPSMPSYLIENLILDYYELPSSEATQGIGVEVAKILGYICINILKSVSDPKGIQGDINSLTADERTKISNRAKLDCKKAIEALELEVDGNVKASFDKWREIFGSDFPQYG